MSRVKVILLGGILLAIFSSSSRAQTKLLTIDDIYDPVKRVNFNGTTPSVRWLKDAKHYLLSNEASRRDVPRIQKVDAATGEAVAFFDSAKMQAAFAALPGISSDDARQLANRGSYHMNPAETAILINWANDLFYYELGSDRAVRLTSNPDEEVGEEFSPDGRMVSFVRGNNLYVEDLSMQRRERALTTDGSTKILNGRLDWVYQEEIYGRGNFGAYWWSPDSSMIAYLRIDESPVPEFTVVDHIPYDQRIEETPYPKAGDPNPIVKLGVVNAVGGGTRWIDTFKYQPEDFLISRVDWSPDSKRVVFQAQNREQTFLDLDAADAHDGKSVTLFRETSKAWVGINDNPHWLSDGSFLWQSERSGWNHFYHYSADGKLLGQVTDGKWEVSALEGLDTENGLVYFTGTRDSHIAQQLYRVKVDGTGLTRLTPAEGSHRIQMSPMENYFVDFWSDINTPTQTRLYDSSGKLVRAINDNPVALKDYKLGATTLLQVKTRDGFPMEAMMIKPPDFDASKKYPVMVFTYGGPHAPQVRNSWGQLTYMWHQLLAQKGYIIWICDNRTASGKGLESTWEVYKNFGELELRDIEDGLSWLKGQPYVDGGRIGIWGWSYGGFMTSYALTHSQSFKIGIAGGTVTDWRNYDSIYTERYMRTPQNNPDGYKKSGPVFAAKDLHGKLLLIHGAIDDNVHMQNTIQFVYELQKAGKQFQLMVYPKSRHGVSDPLLLKHMRQMMTDFIVANL
ncbi:MAG TPA: S9 family peptidase [Pyrinomonadaceae bacterium]|jgi:dipeptidyl-peptidase-4